MHGKYRLGLDLDALRPLAAVVTVFSGQAVFYAVRAATCGVHVWVMLSSVIDVLMITTLATRGILMVPLSAPTVLAVLAGAIVFAFILDAMRVVIFHRSSMA